MGTCGPDPKVIVPRELLEPKFRVTTGSVPAVVL